MRLIAGRCLSVERTLQVPGQHRAGAHGIDAGFGVREVDARRDIAGGKDIGVRSALLAIAHGDETAFAEAQPGCSKPGWRRDAGGGDDAIAGDEFAAVEDQTFIMAAGASRMQRDAA